MPTNAQLVGIFFISANIWIKLTTWMNGNISISRTLFRITRISREKLMNDYPISYSWIASCMALLRVAIL